MTLLDTLITELAEQLKHNQQRLCTVESCTGGSIGQALTERPGSSQWYEGGWITYSNALKMTLGVSGKLLERYGPVSQEVALAMARSGKQQANTDIAISVTGLAGPEGDQHNPVGTIWLAWDLPNQQIAQCFHFNGHRQRVREKAVLAAIQGLLSYL